MRRALFYVSAIYLLALLLLGILVQMASPAPLYQEVRGVGIVGSSRDGTVYLSGRRLDCVRSAGIEPFTTKCTVEIAGKELELYARRNPPSDLDQLGGRCRAVYAGKEWPCSIASRTVSVHWFAYLGDSLGLSQPQLDALRRRYPFENLPEVAILGGVTILSLVTSLVVIALIAGRLWPWLKNKVAVALAATAMGVVTGVSFFVLSLFFTAGFWD